MNMWSQMYGAQEPGPNREQRRAEQRRRKAEQRRGQRAYRRALKEQD